MKFIKDDEHKIRIIELIEQSSKIIICSGWLLNDGLELLVESMEKSMEKNTTKSITIYASSEKGHCEVKKLKELNKNKKFTYKLLKKKVGKVHTKLYYFEFENQFIAIIGSANITKGGLCNNKELSLEITDAINSQNYNDIQQYIKSLNEL